MTKQRKILITNALPYANGPLHFGHMLEFIQTDIWARFQRIMGNQVTYVCGNDAHGTPIMIKADDLGITPEQLVSDIHTSHSTDLEGFNISLDNFHTTHCDENRVLSAEIYNKLKENDITTKTISQAYDVEKGMFLADRYIKGECPKCGAKDQYGDNCEVCGATYTPTDLVNPKSTLSGTTPEMRDSEHYFFDLPNYEEKLKQWMKGDHLQSAVKNKLGEWFENGLLPWDISRDEPYFGFKIPGTEDKYFYVWLDAPIGYLASFKNLCDKSDDLDFNEYWKPDSTTELYHFLGKDVMYFHCLFWPAMLMGANLRTPTAIYVHGFLTVDGTKMSKSRGTFINASTYLKHLNPEYLRYYFAAKLSDGVDDIDLNNEDFVQRVNSDLVGKVINIASRTAGFITKKFDGELAGELTDTEQYQMFVDAGKAIAQYFESRKFSAAIRDIMALADKANEYIAAKEPWALAKDESKLPEVQLICTQALNLFKVIMTYLKPIVPTLTEKTESFFNVEPLTWHDIHTPLLGCKINKFKPMLQRIEAEQIEAMINDSRA